MSQSKIEPFSAFGFNFARFNLDGSFSKDDRNRMSHWIDRARCLLIEILRSEHVKILYVWFNIYDGIYDRLNSFMQESICLELLRALPEKTRNADVCTTLSNIISSFEISIPHPSSLKSPTNSRYRISGLAEKVFDFSQDCAAVKVIDGKITIFLNHQIFDVNRKKEDAEDKIEESTGILFLAVVLAHEITHGMNLVRSIENADMIEKKTPKLLLFRSYSHGGQIDGGNLVERLLLDGELHLSKPPPIPPILFLIISADGTQVPLSQEVVEECLEKRSFTPISHMANVWLNDDIRRTSSTDSKKLTSLEPFLILRTLPSDFDPSPSPNTPRLISMMHAQ